MNVLFSVCVDQSQDLTSQVHTTTTGAECLYKSDCESWSPGATFTTFCKGKETIPFAALWQGILCFDIS